MNSTSHRPFIAPVGRPQSGARHHTTRRRTEDLVPSADREREFVQGSAEPFQEQRAPRFVVPKQPHAAHTIGQAQHGDLVRRSITVARDEQLQHRRCTAVDDRLGDERLRRIVVRAADVIDQSRSRPATSDGRSSSHCVARPRAPCCAPYREQRPSAPPTRLGSTYTGRATMPPSGTDQKQRPQVPASPPTLRRANSSSSCRLPQTLMYSPVQREPRAGIPLIVWQLVLCSTRYVGVGFR